MDFFRHQDDARKRTAVLLLLFGCVMAAVVAGIYLVIVALHGGKDPWRPEILATVAVVVFGICGVSSAQKIASLRDGGRAIAALLGGRLVPPDAQDPHERRLRNVVEEMSLAAGVPAPQVFVLDRETGINAFAAGNSTSDAVVAVTHGALRLLTREELQGVVAHEFSHVLNGDSRLKMQIVGILAGLVVITQGGRLALHAGAGSRNSKGGGGIVMIGLALLILGGIGLLLGSIIKAALSRERENLADASAVQFTRNPIGLASALKKIGGHSKGARVNSAALDELSHFFFVEPRRSFLATVMATHPPLEKRIRRLEPAFDGRYPNVEALPDPPPVQPPPPKAAAPTVTQVLAAAMADAARGGRKLSLDARDVMASVGSLTSDQLDAARPALGALPAELRQASHEIGGAVATVLALVLDDAEDARERQLQELRPHLPAALLADIERVAAAASSLPRSARLPLLELCLPTLRQLSAPQAARLRDWVERLVHLDQRVTVFELVMTRVLRHHLAPPGEHAKPPQHHGLTPLLPDCVHVLTALAAAGASSAAEVSAALDAALAALKAPTAVAQGALRSRQALDLDVLAAALDRLALASPPIKRRFIGACARCVAHDGVTTVAEAELLRVIAASLDIPMPPLAPAA